MPAKPTCKTSCNRNLDDQMLSILIGCADTPTDPAVVLSMVKVYGYCKVAAYYNPDSSDTTDPNLGKITKENLALALSECDKNILCLALKCIDAQGNIIFTDIQDINSSANAGLADSSNDPMWTLPQGALAVNGNLPSTQLLKQLKAFHIDACCLCYDDIFILAGGSFDTSTGDSNFIITCDSTQTDINASLTVAQNMWELCPQTNRCAIMLVYFGVEGLWYLYPCPLSPVNRPHNGPYTKPTCLDVCPKLTPVEVLQTCAYGDIVGQFSTDQPAFYNTLVGLPWTIRGSCSFDSNSDAPEQLLWRQVDYMFCHVSTEEFCCAIEQERELYLHNVGTVTYPGDMPISQWAFQHYDQLPNNVLACADKIVQLQKYNPTYSIGLDDITRVCPGLNMCELLKLIASLRELTKVGCQTLVALDTCVKLITYKDVLQGGDYYPSYVDSDIVASPNDLICVANALNVAPYFVESQHCVKDSNGCVENISAETLLQLTFIQGVFSPEGTHKSGNVDKSYKTPDHCPQFTCDCYESLEKFRCALASLYVYNNSSYVVSSKISTWIGCGGATWGQSLIDVSTIVVDNNDTFKDFKGYALHARDAPIALIKKVAPINHGLVATIATITGVDTTGSTETILDGVYGLFLVLAEIYGFALVFEAYSIVYKTGRSNGVGNTYDLSPLGGQRVNPVGFTQATNCDNCYTVLSYLILEILTCGPLPYAKQLMGQFLPITKEQISLVPVDGSVPAGSTLTNTQILGAAMLSTIKNKFTGQNIIEAFTIPCNTNCENSCRVYNIVKEAFDNDSNSSTASTYIIRTLSQTQPLKDIITSIGIYTLANNLSDTFAQTVINRFPLGEVVGCHQCDNNVINVDFDDVVFIIDSYVLDENSCLTSCQSLPWHLAAYTEVFSDAPDTSSTASGSGSRGQDIRYKIESFLNGRPF